MKQEVIEIGKKKLGEFLKNRRKSKNISIWKLSQLSGMAIHTIHAVERGDKAYTVDTLMSIMDALDLYIFFADREGHHLDNDHMQNSMDKPIGPKIPKLKP